MAFSILLTVLALAPTSFQEEAAGFPRATPESQGLSSAALATLVEDVNGYLARDLVVGAELIVIKNRHVVLHECFGDMDREDELAWTPGTICNIRSMTKPLTGAAAQILIDRGQLAIDDPVAKYLPGFDTDKAREITVGQLMMHRSGLPLTTLKSMDEHPNLEEIGNAVGEHGPEYEPDSRFWYSDAGTEALGAVVEVVSKKRLDTFVQEELLDPLGMSSSLYFFEDEDPRRGAIASLYYGGAQHWKRFLDPDDGSFYPFAWGSQSLYSTPEDYAKFLAMWMDSGRAGERAVLSEAAVTRMLTPVSEMSMLGSEARFPTSFKGLEVFYGQTAVLHVPTAAKGAGPATIIGHSGSDGTIAWAWPERDLMILYFTQSRGGGTALRLEESIDRALISPTAYADEPAIPEEYREYLGTYVADWANHMKEEFVVLYRNGKLAIDVPSQMVLEMAPTESVEGVHKWTLVVAPVISVWFERDASDKVDCLRIQQGPMTFEAPRKGTPHEAEVAEANRPDPEVVAPLLGAYLDSESETPNEVFVDGDYLAVRTAEAVFHLWKVPVEDVWQVRENPMMAITFELEDERVVSMTRHGVGGTKHVMPRQE